MTDIFDEKGRDKVLTDDCVSPTTMKILGKIRGDKEQYKAKRFWQDVPNMILLVILYSFQGLPMGLFLKSIPVLFKQYLSY